ncbi:hypothetical protein [Clostridium sp.]|uniref:hypothetical protein n=1 Tax=Clostridium sp. TaxID=1506 RepID=UPI00260BA685|nr:hypothetical protein [Clostridium sp.]
MGKPSIFSRDYEQKMRKRRKKIALISIIISLVIGVLLLKLISNNINGEAIRNRVQAWVDSDRPDNNTTQEELNEEIDIVIPEKEPEKEMKIMELKIDDNSIIKVEYEQLEGKDIFKEVKENQSNIYYDINPSKNIILTIDEKQNMKIFSTDKKESVVHKDKYVAPTGEAFIKENVLTTYKDYIWNGSAKFINDTTIAYISNVPYFGYDLNQYIWILNLSDNSHKTIWSSKGKEIKLNTIKENGLEVTIDGNAKYINENGEIFN